MLKRLDPMGLHHGCWYFAPMKMVWGGQEVPDHQTIYCYRMIIYWVVVGLVLLLQCCVIIHPIVIV